MVSGFGSFPGSLEEFRRGGREGVGGCSTDWRVLGLGGEPDVCGDSLWLAVRVARYLW